MILAIVNCWKHWLERAKHPFEVIIDDQNLEYLREAQRLNPRQARWALFFTRFNFKVPYRPGSRNFKADALSRVYSPEVCSTPPEPILSPAIITNPIQWSLDDQINEALQTEPAPQGDPKGRYYIPTALRIPLKFVKLCL